MAEAGGVKKVCECGWNFVMSEFFLKRGMHMLYESECLDICLFPPCTPYNAFLFACLRV